MAGKAPPHPAALPIDLRAVTDTLRGGRATDAWMNTWLPSTHAAPAGGFDEAMFAHLGARRGAVFKSRAREGHDLYHDLVSAHLGKRRVALIGREGAGFERVSYEALHARCNALAAAWLEQGIAPEQVIALLLAPGIDLAVCLLTAWRLGAVASLIPPLGPSFVRKSLARIGADRAAAPGRLRALLGAEGARALPVSAGARPTGPLGSFTYPPGAPAARLLTPFGLTDDGAWNVPARTLLEGSARDATFVYTLDPEDVIAAPGFDPVQHEPSLLVAALVAGAAHAAVSVADLEAEPELLAQQRVTVLGLHRGVRDAIRARKAGLPASVRAWFRSLTDIVDGSGWDDFWRTVPDRMQPGFSVVTNAASGGACLFSAPSSEPPSLRVFPAPGLCWKLTELAAGQVPAINDSGVFTVVRGDEPDPSFVQAIIGRWGEGFAYAGSLDIGPDAHPYPFAEVEAVVESLPEVRHAAAFVVAGRWLNEAKIVLLAFVERPEGPGGKPVELHEVKAVITRELGERFAPDRIEILPLRPRLRDGVVDRSWCRSQYLTGALSRKARSEIFVLIGRLGYIFARQREAK